MARAIHRSSRAGGYTLAEMIVVLAVLVLLAALTLPALRTPLRKGELRDAAGMLRAELTRARLRAIETGVPQQFRFRPGKGRFEVASRTSSVAGNSLAFSGGVTRRLGNAGDVPAKDEPRRHDLPEGVIFYDQETAIAVSSRPGDLLGADTRQWSPPIVFYPNGRTHNARIRLRGGLGYYVDVVVRGATGSATASEVRKHEEVVEEQGP